MSLTIGQIKRNSIGLKKFANIRNKICIIREVGGLGDILVHRMIFEDIKLLWPDCHLTFACPKAYHETLTDHPFLDEIIDFSDVNPSDYILCYNTSTACGRYESSIAPLSGLNRSDIWAAHCGLHLTKHDMNFRLSQETIKKGKDIVKNICPLDAPILAICPVSSMPTKNLLPSHIDFLVPRLKEKFQLFASHDSHLDHIYSLGVPIIVPGNLHQWMGVLNAADYVLSVDTSSFHFVGGIGKPVCGVFTFADSKVYSRFYPKVELVQKHRDNGDWSCGPCFLMSNCCKTSKDLKPCLTELSGQEILDGVLKLVNRFPK